MNHNEENISAKCTQAKARPWISSPDENQGRSIGAETQARQGSQGIVRLTGSASDRPPIGSHWLADDMADHGFPPSQRLRRPGEFDAVFKKAQLRVNYRALLFLAKPNDMNHSRLGIVVGKKAAPRAVERNRLKRLMRESFRLNCTMETVDIVIVARPPARDYPNRQLLELMNQAWRELEEKERRTIQ